MRVFVTTCDRYLWALRGFAYQFNRYWSELQEVVIIGYKRPDFDLPPNFTFASMGDDPGKDDWTGGVIRFLESVTDSHFVLLLEDYWLCRGVNHQAVATLGDLAQSHPQILRIDLTDDRQYNGQVQRFDYLPYYGYLDVLWTPPDSPYQMSLQAGIWSRRHLLDLLIPGRSAWDVEIGEISQGIKERTDLWVLGTRQRPVRYANVFNSGKPGKVILDGLTEDDKKLLDGMGFLKS